MRSVSFFPFLSLPMEPEKMTSCRGKEDEDEEESHFKTRHVFRAQPPGTELIVLERERNRLLKNILSSDDYNVIIYSP